MKCIIVLHFIKPCNVTAVGSAILIFFQCNIAITTMVDMSSKLMYFIFCYKFVCVQRLFIFKHM